MINPNDFLDLLLKKGIDFFSGVPDSHLQSFNNAIINRFQFDSSKHIVAVNEGNAVALAAGYHLATGKCPCIYLQNSGIGNIINPVASLLNDKVYAIPSVFVIGWRGEPGVKDEPQHIFQGQITLKLLECLDIKTFIIDSSSTIQDIENILDNNIDLLHKGKQIAFIIKKNIFDKVKIDFQNDFSLIREKVIEMIVNKAKDDIIVSTTGKISRELFEIREKNNMDHNKDFLTVGSMGHSSSIALSIALNKKDKTIWCIDGDGAALMHLGSMALIANKKTNNFIHILINNASHESVGGVPTICADLELYKLAKDSGYKESYLVNTYEELSSILDNIKNISLPAFIEIKVSMYSRDDLGRPTISSIENKNNFMKYIK